MRTMTLCAVLTGSIACGALVASLPRRVEAQSTEKTVGPVVGEVSTFREKQRPNGSAIYENKSARVMIVTLIFEVGTDDATLSVKDAAGKSSIQCEASAGAMERQRAATIDVGVGGSLWLKSAGGTARWQVVAAVPAN